MNTALDPWNDAGLIAQRLNQQSAALFVIVGAEQWCEKCRDLRPHFDAFLANADSQATWLWLDLEEHAEFVGDFMPESLPMLIAYKGNQLVPPKCWRYRQLSLTRQSHNARTKLLAANFLAKTQEFERGCCNKIGLTKLDYRGAVPLKRPHLLISHKKACSALNTGASSYEIHSSYCRLIYLLV